MLMMRKLSIRHKSIRRKLSSRHNTDEQEFVEKMKRRVKRDPDVQEKFREYGVDLDEIDDIQVEFCDLDVSAKTKDQKIQLNRAMLNPDNDIGDPAHYLAHELVHVLQQITGNIIGHFMVDDYLDKPTELEAFQVQVKFKERHESKEEADEYIESLLDHHDIDDPKERSEKQKELRDKAE